MLKPPEACVLRVWESFMIRKSRASVRILVATGMVLSAFSSAAFARDEGRRYMPGEMLVSWRGQADRQPRVSVVKTDRDVMATCEEFKKDPSVAWAQPNYQYHPCLQPNDPDFPDQYAHQLIEMAQAWEISTGSRDMVIAILGTGVEISHPDLKDNIWANAEEIPDNQKDDDGNGYIDDIHGWNFEGADSDVTPDPFSSEFFNHETQVAGVIGAVGHNAVGVTGVNWQCSMMVLRLSENFTSAEIAGALKYAADNGAKVINMSFGGSDVGPDDDLAVKEAVEYAADHGVLLVASAGNSDTGTPHYPAAYSHVMAVSSTDGEDMKTGHSTYGPWVDIAAPGTDIMTTDVNGEYVATAGTSFSAPYVAAVGALVWSHRPELTAVEVRAILENTADPVFYDRVDPNDGYLGVGRVNAYRAVLAAFETRPLGEIASPAPWQTLPEDAETLDVALLVQGQAYDLSIRSYGDSAWTEMAGSDSALDFNEPVSVAVKMLPEGVYEMRLTVTSGEHTHEDSVVFGVGQMQHQAGWPRYITSGNFVDETYYYSPLCHDTTGDGQNEILQASLTWTGYWPEYRINLWDQDGENRPGWPVAVDTMDPPVCRVGDIDGDGDLEVVAAFYYDNLLYAWHAESGELLEGDWPLLVSDSWYYSISAPPVLADLDGDGDSEILVGMDGTDATSDGLHAIQGDGSFLWQRRYSIEGPVAVADMDQDGDVEIALCGYGPGISRIYTYILNHNGQMVKKWLGGSVKGVVVTDVDSDGQGDVVFATEDSVQAVALDGSTIWSTPLDAPIDRTGALSVGDLDSDGIPEIFMSTSVIDDAYTYSLLYAFDHAGEILSDQGFPKILMGDAEECEPLIADIDHDGQKELIAGAAGLPYMAWEADGSVTPGFPMLSLAGDYWCTPAIVDLDQDGDLEFMVPGYDWRFYVVDMDVPYDAGSMDWVMARHDPQGSGWFSPALIWGEMDVPDTILVGDTLTIALADTVSDQSSVWFTVGDLPQGAIYDANTLTILWKPTMDQAFESHTFHVSMTNGIQQISRLFHVTVQMEVLYYASMDADPEWQLDAGWSWGTPLGLGSWGGDPAAAFSGTSILGFALAGDYANDLDAPRHAQLGPVNCLGHDNVTLSFQRWLGIEAPYDQAAIQVSNDAIQWTDLWVSGQAHIADQTWQHVTYAVPDAVARDQATVYFRWSLGPTDATVTYPGWNLDDVMVSGDQIKE